MKHSILALGFLLPIICFGQLEVKKVEPEKVIAEYKTAGTMQAQISTHIMDNKDTAYMVTFQDAQYSLLNKYEAFTLTGINSIRDFVALLKNAKKGEEYKAKAEGGTELTIQYISGTLFVLAQKRERANFFYEVYQ